MQTILNVIVPIFGLIALGFLCARVKLLSEATGEGLAQFVFSVSIPVLLFKTLATAHFGEASPLLIWLVYFAAAAAVWVAGAWLVKLLAATDRRTGVIAGIASSFANTVFVGIPAVERAYGQPGLEPLLLIIAIHMPVMMVVSTLLIERAAILDARAAGTAAPATSPAATLRRLAMNLATNPIILGILAGILWRITGLEFPEQLDTIIGLLSGTAAPLALFSLGMSLTRYGVKGDLLASLAVSALSLLVMPAIVFALGVAVLPTLWLKVAVLTAACPVGVNAYLFAAYFKSGEKLATTTIIVSTILSVVTISFWLTILS